MTQDRSPPLIRRASQADAHAAAHCHAVCWQEAYAGIVGPDRLRALTSDVGGRVTSWRRSLAGGSVRWIAVAGAEGVVGFAAAGPNRDADLAQLDEVYACYTRTAYWGTGLGSRLFEAAVGDSPASLWVFEANHRARPFYRRHGFAEDGAVQRDPRFDADEIRMVRGG